MKEDEFLFRPFTQDDLPAVWERQRRLHALSSEFDAARLYAWLLLDCTEIAFWRDQFVFRFRSQGETWYIAPYEIEAFPELLNRLADYERNAGGKALRFLSVERPPTDFPAGFTATPRRDLYDYLYRAEDLIFLKGRAYAAKRNQISQFRRNYQWRFEPLSLANRDACLDIMTRWDSVHPGDMPANESVAIRRLLTLSGEYGQSGGLLFADRKPVAFALGTHPRDSLLDIVAEKALSEYTGSYTSIIQAYSEYAYSLAPFQHINREEDMGLENLRNAKLQLKPERLIEKTLMTTPL